MELNHTSKYIAPTIKRFIPTSTHPSYSCVRVFKHSTFPSQGITAKRTRGIVLFSAFSEVYTTLFLVRIGATLSLPICKKESSHVRSKPMSILTVVLYQQNTTTRYQCPTKVLAFHGNLQGGKATTGNTAAFERLEKRQVLLTLAIVARHIVSTRAIYTTFKKTNYFTKLTRLFLLTPK